MPENLLTTVEQKELLKAKAVLDALPDNIFVFTIDGTCIEVYEGQDRESPDFKSDDQCRFMQFQPVGYVETRYTRALR